MFRARILTHHQKLFCKSIIESYCYSCTQYTSILVCTNSSYCTRKEASIPYFCTRINLCLFGLLFMCLYFVGVTPRATSYLDSMARPGTPRPGTARPRTSGAARPPGPASGADLELWRYLSPHGLQSALQLGTTIFARVRSRLQLNKLLSRHAQYYTTHTSILLCKLISIHMNKKMKQMFFTKEYYQCVSLLLSNDCPMFASLLQILDPQFLKIFFSRYEHRS